MELTRFPRLFVTPKQDSLVRKLVEEADKQDFGECSWLGFGTLLPNKMGAIVEEIVSPEQENSSGESDMDSEDVHKICMDQLDKGRVLVWWGHSHGKMSTFFSGTDVATFNQLTGSKPEMLFATVHTAKDLDERYDVLYVGGAVAAGDNTTMYQIRQLVIGEDELEQHTSKWKKAPVAVAKANPYGFAGWKENENGVMVRSYEKTKEERRLWTDGKTSDEAPEHGIHLVEYDWTHPADAPDQLLFYEMPCWSCRKKVLLTEEEIETCQDTTCWHCNTKLYIPRKYYTATSEDYAEFEKNSDYMAILEVYTDDKETQEEDINS